MRNHTNHKAFTMIELLFVIVVLGIVGGFALEAIRQYYEGIYRTQEYSKRVAEADHILEQLSKYFENAISVSIVNIDQNAIDEGTCKIPDAGDENNDYTVAFAAVDEDSLRGQWNGTRYQPGWSEDVRLNENNITASDANYTMAGNIIHVLDPNSAADMTDSAIYDADSLNVPACSRFDWNASGIAVKEGFHTIDAITGVDSTLALNVNNFATDGKRKYLIRTAYAFRVINNPGQSNDGDFKMYSNFRPWKINERYNNATFRKESILGKNVAHFYADYNATDFQNDSNVTDRGLVWRLKVCMRGLDTNLSMSNAEGQAICRERRVHVRY
jgi:prepilin-type N-terminal cleavage/methylation domain-containing protein